MNNLYLNDYLSSLTSQISSSVERLKTKESSSREAAPLFDSATENGTESAGQNSLRNYAYTLLDSSVAYQLFDQTGGEGSVPDSSYAAGSYQFAGGVLRQPTVLIDFMFTGNREFDFKV